MGGAVCDRSGWLDDTQGPLGPLGRPHPHNGGWVHVTIVESPIKAPQVFTVQIERKICEL